MFDQQQPDGPYEEARRQVSISNACRYCEGYCAVFPEITRMLEFSDAEIAHLSNLCHNCRGCYYACQYAPPHEFALNLPAALAQSRTQSWEDHAWPRNFARLFKTSGVLISGLFVLALTGLFWLISALGETGGEGFYAHLSHGMMVAIFIPAFVLPLAAMWISVSRYWRASGGCQSVLARHGQNDCGCRTPAESQRRSGAGM